jgi:hypothetical protein
LCPAQFAFFFLRPAIAPAFILLKTQPLAYRPFVGAQLYPERKRRNAAPLSLSRRRIRFLFSRFSKSLSFEAPHRLALECGSLLPLFFRSGT